MKNKLIILLLAIASLSFVKLFSQNVEQNSWVPVDNVTGLIAYTKVIQTNGSRQELYDRAIAWVNSFYVNPVDATKVRSPESGIIEINHRFRITNTDDLGIITDAGMIHYFLKLELRDGRYKYTMDNFTLRQTSRYPLEKWLDKTDKAYDSQWENYLKQVNEFSNDLLGKLIEAMKPVAQKAEEEW